MPNITRRSAMGLLAAAAVIPKSAFAADPIRIGAAISQTGNLADSSKYFQYSYKIWQDEVNARGGILNRPVEFVHYDDRSDPATAGRLYERLITSDKVDLLMAPFGSGTTAVASAVAERNKRVFFNNGGASESIQQRGFKYVFQTATRSSAFVLGVGPLLQSLGYKTVAFIGRDYPAARDMQKAFGEIAGNSGVELVSTEFFPSGTLDYSVNIANLRRLQPDVVLGVLYPNEAIEMTRQFKSLNYAPKMFISNGAAQTDFAQNLGNDANFICGMTLYEASLKTTGNQEFVKTFTEKHGEAPSYYAALAYAGAQVLEGAVKKAGALDQEKIREVMTTFEIDTIMGHHKVDPTTLMQVGLIGYIIQHQGGKKVLIYPAEYREAEPMAPMPAWSAR